VCVCFFFNEKAITVAFSDRFSPDKTAIVMVVGAGRGPLVNCCIRAANYLKLKVDVYAIEKNPNAVVT